MIRLLSLALVLLTLGSGCSEMFGGLRPDSEETSPMVERARESLPETSGGKWKERGYLNAEKHKFPHRYTKDDFIDHSQEEGSLWASSGQTNYYFTKNRIRNPGDLITLTIDNDLYRDIGVEMKRVLSEGERVAEIAAVQAQFRAKTFAAAEASRRDSITTSAASPTKSERSSSTAAGTPPAQSSADSSSGTAGQTENTQRFLASLSPEDYSRLEKSVPKAGLSDVDLLPFIELKVGDTMMGELIDRYPNGNYRIKTLKRVRYKGGPPRMVSVIGIVKGSEIKEDTDIVNSDKLYEYRIEASL